MPPHSPTYKKINRRLGKALHRYNMICDGDRILVGLSGGKDSLILMWFLNERLRRVRVTYELNAVYLDPGFEAGFAERLQRYCRDAGYRLRIEHTDFGVKAHSDENRENPCFLCAWKRRKRLFDIADELGCRKLALGHNKDDIIETLFMNMCYAGEISTMMPFQPLFEGRFTVIRPLAYVDEDLIRQFAAEQDFPEFISACPSAAVSKRRAVKELLLRLYSSNDKIKGNIFRSLSRVRPEYLLT
ncbi:MAG: ATP-binding protein [Desulfobacterales bacterium]